MASETSQFEVSEPETQFVPKSDDEDTLWTVLEILQEKGKRYKVKWAGIDPETKKPWAPSWVHKHDCTPDLVAEWKRKKLSKKMRRNSSKSFRGGSTISRVSKSDTLSKASNASSSTTVPHKSRQSASKNETDYDSPPTAGPSKPRQTLTKKSQPLPEPESESEESDTYLIQRSSHTPQKRKRVSSDSEDLPDVATLVRSLPKKRKLNEPSRRNGSGRNSDSARGSMGPFRKSKSISKELTGNGNGSGRSRAASAVSSDGRKSPSNLEDKADGRVGPSKISDRASVGSSKHATSHGRLTALNGSRKSSLKSISRAPSQSPPAEEGIYADAPHVEPPSSPPVTFPTKRPDPIYRNLSPSTSLRLKEWEDELALIDREREEAAAAAATAVPPPPSPRRDEMPPPTSPLHDQQSQPSPSNDSYRKGVIPATDTESSNNTQSQSQQIASQESNQPLQRTTSLVKSMKGKSPSKANLNEKPKGPIPQLSPSTFTPYLCPQPIGEDGEIPSSIEQFSSPVRPSGDEIVMRASVSEDGRDGPLHDRGAQLAEEARTKMRGPTIKKLSLLDIQRQYKEKEKERAKAKSRIRSPEPEKVQAIEYPNSNENTRTDADDEADGDGARPNDEDAKALLRREEEESSQDILAELQRAQAGHKPVDEPPIVPQAVDVPMQIDEVADLMYPSESYVDDGPPHVPTSSEPNSEDVVVPVSKATENIPVPPTSPPPVLEPRTSLLSPEDESELGDLRSQLARALKVLNAKSEEIVNLDRLLVAEREKNELLQKQTMVQVTDEQHERDQSTIRLLTVSLEDANKAKLAAEKDRDFVREQYMNASGYVTTVRNENAELEKRAQIAEKQATEGVALVRATFTERIRFLEEDVKSWRQMADFAVAKDSRMNDDIRRRAAEAPELEYRNEKLKEEIEDLTTHVGELNSELAKKDEELHELHIRLEMDIPELVYPCHWRPVGGEGPCDALLESKEELEKHVLTAPGHLQ